jgi:hypothetical protein
MPSKSPPPVTYAALKRKALALPEVEESTSYGTPALKVRGKLMVRLKEDMQTVVLRTTWEERDRLVTVYPEVFFVTDHYRKHPWVLMSLGAAASTLLNPVLETAWRLSAPPSLAAKPPSSPAP